MAAVEPAKSASATTAGGHSGWASTTTPGWASRNSRMSSGVNRSCTSQWPVQAITSTSGTCAATFRARYSSGSMMTRDTPRDAMTFAALPEVQQISDSAFTAAEVFTYVTTGTPG